MISCELTKREAEITELFAWGASKKDIANKLFISERTVENHARHIFEKTGCSKVNELSAWWFCTKFHISFDLSPLKRSVLAGAFLIVMTMQVFTNESITMARPRTSRITETRIHRKADDLL